MRPTRIQNTRDLISRGNVSGRTSVINILEAALEAADPYKNTRRLIDVKMGRLIVGYKHFEPQGTPITGSEVYDFHKLRNIFVIGAGKGCQRVAKALEDSLGSRLTGGHVIDRKGSNVILKRIGVTLGGHPLPDQDCLEGSEKILEIANRTTKDDLVFTVTSNGVSSLLTMPVPGVNIEDIRDITYKVQIEQGAPTRDLNPIRNHLDMMRGGRISKHIYPAKMIHIIADDPGEYCRLMNHNFWIATLPDCSTFKDAVFLLKRWKAWNAVARSVRKHLTDAQPNYESVKAKEFQKMSFRIFGVMPRKKGMIAAARKKAEELGFKSVVLAEHLQAEAAQAGSVVATIAKTVEQQQYPFEPPVALFTSGELLVTVGKNSGTGGRNQEFVLSAALKIQGSKNIVIGAADSDGTDGPDLSLTQTLQRNEALPSLAGGIVDGKTVDDAIKLGINIQEELQKHNASFPLWRLKSGIVATNNISMDDITVTLILKSSEKSVD